MSFPVTAVSTCIHLINKLHTAFLLLLLQEKAISIWQSKDFFIELEPLPGGVEALKEMAKMDE